MKWKFLLLGTLEFLVALGAIPSGLSMIIRPDGSGLGFTTDYLVNAPFSDFLIPGIVLFSVIGLCNGAGVFLSLLRKPQAGSAGILLGIFLMAWILLIGPSPRRCQPASSRITCSTGWPPPVYPFPPR